MTAQELGQQEYAVRRVRQGGVLPIQLVGHVVAVEPFRQGCQSLEPNWAQIAAPRRGLDQFDGLFRLIACLVEIDPEVERIDRFGLTEGNFVNEYLCVEQVLVVSGLVSSKQTCAAH